MAKKHRTSTAGHIFWWGAIAIAPLTAAIMIFDVVQTSTMTYSAIIMGVMISCMAGLLWPVTWAVWAFQYLSGNETAISRAIAVIVGT